VQFAALRASDDGKNELLWLDRLRECKLKVYLFQRTFGAQNAPPKKRDSLGELLPVSKKRVRTLKVNLSDTSTAPSITASTFETGTQTSKRKSEVPSGSPVWRLRPIVEQAIVTYKSLLSLGVPADDVILCTVWNEINATQHIPGFEHQDANFCGEIKQLLRGYGKSNSVLCQMIIDSPHDAERVIRALASAFQPALDIAPLMASGGEYDMSECSEFGFASSFC
jgi:hypothetical protein